MFKALYTTLLCLVGLNTANAQLSTDSLKAILNNSSDPKIIIENAMILGDVYLYTQRDSSFSYLELARKLSENTKDTQSLIKSTAMLGWSYQFTDPKKSAEYIFTALELVEQSRFNEEKEFVYNSVGTHYRLHNDLDKAIEYYNKSLALNQNIGDSLGLAAAFNNLGIAYMMKAEYDKGIDYWYRSLETKLALGEDISAAITMSNIAIYYKDIGKTKEARDLIEEALKIDLKYHNMEGASKSYITLGQLQKQEGQIQEAVESFKLALATMDSLNTPFEKQEPLLELIAICDSTNNYELAYNYLQDYLEVYKQFNDQSTERVTKELQTKYESSEKERENLLLKSQNKDQEIRLKETEVKRKEEAAQNKVQAANNKILIVVLVAAILALISIVWVLRKVRSAKKSIEIQKLIVDQKNQEITDSISYAQRLQNAILPSVHDLETSFKDSFVIYQPKDIVAGDFFWMEKENGHIWLAVADCTGHGVPGALVSIVCANALHQALYELNKQTPGELLTATRQLVIERLSRSNSNVKDGMDISLIKISGNTIQWAGANNPLWILRHDASEMDILPPHKQPVGQHPAPVDFPTHTFQCTAGDQLYLFSDGYPDQFGGPGDRPGGKKFKSKRFRRTIISVANQPMTDQKKHLQKVLENWMGDHEQLDDICVIGIKIA